MFSFLRSVLGKQEAISELSVRPAAERQTMGNRETAAELSVELARKTKEVQIIQTIASKVNSTLDLDRTLKIILGAMDGAFGFKHSMILVYDEADKKSLVVASQGYTESGIGSGVALGEGVVGTVAKYKKMMRINHARIQGYIATVAKVSSPIDKPAIDSSGRAKLPGLENAQSQLAVPLLVKDRLIGVFSVESPSPGAFDALDEPLMVTVGNQIASAIDNARLYRLEEERFEELQKAYENLRQLSAAYERFVPRQFLSFLGKESILQVKLGDQVEKEMTILFSDIRSFTSLSEAMTPQENFNFINSYLSRMEPIIGWRGGFIDKYIGDGIMALFPISADDAVSSAVDMLEQLTEYNQYRQKMGYQPIRIGIGLHTGLLMLGTVGGQNRMDGTVISDAVNLASRLEGLTKVYGASIVVSEQTLLNLHGPERFNFRSLGKVKVKGKNEAVAIFEVLDGAAEDVVALKLSTRPIFEEGLKHYHNQRLAEAKTCFQNVLKAHPEDKAAELYLQYVNRFMEYGIPEDWHGSTILTEK